MRVAAVDIGTNSMRLLVTDGVTEYERRVVVTALGRGVDATGRLSEEAIGATVAVLAGFGEAISRHDVTRTRAIATSAARDAANREEFLGRVERALGVRPELVSGAEEARLAWEGAKSGLSLDARAMVCDIGGGSTELVSGDWRTSIDIGSVRLSDRCLPDRPATSAQMDAARSHVAELLAGIELGSPQMVGVAGTWTSLGAIDLELPRYERDLVHGHMLTSGRLSLLVERLSHMSVEETAAIPSLDPKRAPVILAGAVVAAGVVAAVGSETVLVSERDTLDGVAGELLALA